MVWAEPEGQEDLRSRQRGRFVCTAQPLCASGITASPPPFISHILGSCCSHYCYHYTRYLAGSEGLVRPWVPASFREEGQILFFIFRLTEKEKSEASTSLENGRLTPVFTPSCQNEWAFHLKRKVVSEARELLLDGGVVTKLGRGTGNLGDIPKGRFPKG